MKFKKAIIYGWKLHSHTHSYIHQAFFRAFKYMGYDTYWFDDNDNLDGIDLSDSLFLTEGQACKRMPVVATSTYILHNCYDAELWESINSQSIDYLKLQTFTDDVFKYETEKLEPCIHYDKPGKMIYTTWATDLLPHEINPDARHRRTNKSYWVGSMGDGVFGNNQELDGFKRACSDNGVVFTHANNLSIEENRSVISSSYMAPAIVGTWQKSKGYIPCRIFKNISYGQFGITNSMRVQELFDGRLVYSDNEYDLFGLMKEKMNSPTYEQELTEQIKFVRDHHTYISRINTILSVL